MLLRLCIDLIDASRRCELTMAVRLDRIPARALRPARPRGGVWLGLLLLFLLLGSGWMVVFSDQLLHHQPVRFFGLALGVPLLAWCLLGMGRALLYFGQQYVADGWDEAREQDVVRSIRRGRRAQQVLGVSLYTVLRAPGDDPLAQLDALLRGSNSLKAQPCRVGQAGLRHSRLSDDGNQETEHLLPVLVQVLTDLAHTLALLPDDTPLALLLEVDSGLPQNELRRAWQYAWRESGIRQSAEPIEGDGLDVLDQWLDQRINDQALLMVVALQFAPQPVEGTAEAVVGLLLGNRLTQTVLAPMALLHRPERERGASTETLRDAARQALDWVPLPPTAVEHVWRVGADTQRDAAMATVLVDLPIVVKPNQGLHNLDSLLGHPGKASPWLAIVAATQTLQRGAGPQFIFSGAGSDELGLWSTVVMPVPSRLK